MNKRQLVADLDTALVAQSYVSRLCTAYDAEGMNEAILTREQTETLRAARDVLTSLYGALKERLSAQPGRPDLTGAERREYGIES